MNISSNSQTFLTFLSDTSIRGIFFHILGIITLFSKGARFTSIFIF